jgi:ketosteroid isomerase-like protein
MSQANTPEDTSRLIGQAITSGDLDAALSLYEPDATFALPKGFAEGSVSGHDGLREAFNGFLAMSPELTVNAEKTLLSGDTALVIGNWTLKAATRAGTTSIPAAGTRTSSAASRTAAAVRNRQPQRQRLTAPAARGAGDARQWRCSPHPFVCVRREDAHVFIEGRKRQREHRLRRRNRKDNRADVVRVQRRSARCQGGPLPQDRTRGCAKGRAPPCGQRVPPSGRCAMTWLRAKLRPGRRACRRKACTRAHTSSRRGDGRSPRHV